MYYVYLVTGIPGSPAFKSLQKAHIHLTRHSALPQSALGKGSLDVLLIETEENISLRLLELNKTWKIQSYFVLGESFDTVHRRHFDSRNASLHELVFGKM